MEHPVYYFYATIRFFKEAPRKIKGFFLRGWRGYSHYEYWGIDDYLAEILVGSLKDLKEHTISIPADFETLEPWQETIQKMIDGFEAHLRIIDEDYPEVELWMSETERWTSPVPGTKYTKSHSKITLKGKEYKRIYEEKREKDRQLFNKGLELFCKYYTNLND